MVCAAQNVEIKWVALVNMQRKKDAQGEEFDCTKPNSIYHRVLKSKGIPMTMDVYSKFANDEEERENRIASEQHLLALLATKLTEQS